jgi:hypothetical protein
MGFRKLDGRAGRCLSQQGQHASRAAAQCMLEPTPAGHFWPASIIGMTFQNRLRPFGRRTEVKLVSLRSQAHHAAVKSQVALQAAHMGVTNGENPPLHLVKAS